MENAGTNILKCNYHDFHESPSVVLIKLETIIKKNTTFILDACNFTYKNAQRVLLSTYISKYNYIIALEKYTL